MTRPTPSRGSTLFAVRVWKEDVADGWEYRGTARDVIGGAFRSFRDWSALRAFMVERLQEPAADSPEHTGETK